MVKDPGGIHKNVCDVNELESVQIKLIYGRAGTKFFGLGDIIFNQMTATRLFCNERDYYHITLPVLTTHINER